MSPVLSSSLPDQSQLPAQRPEVCLRLQASVAMPHSLSFLPRVNLFHPQQPNYFAPTQYSTQVPLMVEISPGLLSDGKLHVLSASHPDVKAFIAEARRTLKLPLPPSEAIFVLAALEVFYKPGDPVHWLFWSDDKKNITAEVVTRISRMYSRDVPFSFSSQPVQFTNLLSYDQEWPGMARPSIFQYSPTIMVPPGDSSLRTKIGIKCWCHPNRASPRC